MLVEFLGIKIQASFGPIAGLYHRPQNFKTPEDHRVTSEIRTLHPPTPPIPQRVELQEPPIVPSLLNPSHLV